MKMIMILTKKANTTRTTTEFLNATNSTLFDAQNAGNCILELLDFKFFLGGGGGACLQTPLVERGLTAPLVVTAAYYTFTNVIETPARIQVFLELIYVRALPELIYVKCMQPVS